MRSRTWVGVSGSISGCRKTHRIASVSPISCPTPVAPAASASSCFNSLIRQAISGSSVSPVSRASCSTIGPQCEICSLASVSCRSNSRSLSLADSYILNAVSSAIMILYNNINFMSIVYFINIHTFYPLSSRPKPSDPERKPQGREAEWRDLCIFVLCHAASGSSTYAICGKKGFAFPITRDHGDHGDHGDPIPSPSNCHPESRAPIAGPEQFPSACRFHLRPDSRSSAGEGPAPLQYAGADQLFHAAQR